ncbi:amidohydrolase family protein [Nocardioides jensenii]|uniref:amidohydrolase family protein n=1 Tax=Nocardioides jensenii TaxID=1843 RepID=UPI00082ED26B|nr:amidohydrolase family protein [Nocardioides jensenii]
MFDVHTHFLPRHLPPPSEHALAEGWPELVPDGELVEVRQHDRLVRVLDATAWDAEARLAAMDRLGVEHQVVLPTPFTFLYDADPDVAGEYARAQNEVLAELVAAGSGRLTGFGSVPLQDPGGAVAEVERLALELGLSGVGIGTHADLFELHSPELEPVFARIEELDLPVFVHPWKPMAPTRTSHHGLAFGLGRPVETELAVGSLVFGGVLERHPALRVCLAHGGAGIPAIRGRLGNGWSRQPAETRSPQADPRHLLARLWADGLTYDPEALALAADTFGHEHMVVGSDFPFAAMESPIGASYVNGVAGGVLPYGADWTEVTARNARTFLGSSDPAPEFLGERDEDHPIGAES